MPFTRPPVTNQPDYPNSSADHQNDPSAERLSVRNELPAAIAELYISSSEKGEWGQPVCLGLNSGDEISIPFSLFSGVQGKLYDIGSMDENGVNYDCFDILLLDGDSIVFSLDDETVVFTVTRLEGSSERHEAEVYSQSPSESKLSAFLHPYVTSSNELLEDEAGGAVIAHISSAQISLSADDAERFPLLEYVFSAAAKKRVKALRQACAEFSEAAKALYSESRGSALTSCEFSEGAYLRSADENVLSILYCRDEIIGDTVRRTFSAENFSPKNGAALLLSDIITDASKLRSAMCDYLERVYGDVPFDEEFDPISEADNDSVMLTWTLDPSGLSIIIQDTEFDDDDISCSVFLPYSKSKDYISELYLPKAENYASAFPIGSEYHSLIGGKDASVLISKASDDDMLHIIYNGNLFEHDLNGAVAFEVYHVHTQGKDFLYLDHAFESGARGLSVYVLNNGGAAFLGEFNGSWSYTYSIDDSGELSRLVQPMTDPEDFALYTEVDLLVAADAGRTYSVGADGLPVSEDAYYLIIRPDIELRLKQPIELKYVNDLGETGVGSVLLDEGSLLVYYRTDNKRFADLMLEDGGLVRAPVDDGCIGSIPIHELFDTDVQAD